MENRKILLDIDGRIWACSPLGLVVCAYWLDWLNPSFSPSELMPQYILLKMQGNDNHNYSGINPESHYCTASIIIIVWVMGWLGINQILVSAQIILKGRPLNKMDVCTCVGLWPHLDPHHAYPSTCITTYSEPGWSILSLVDD